LDAWINSGFTREASNFRTETWGIIMATTVLSRLSEIRDAYLSRRALRRDLASFTNLDDLTDIEAAISRSEAHGNAETTELRRVLEAKRVALRG
jgi:hypothetical protein